MICQDARHPDRRKRHPSRASCEVAGRRFEADGPAPIYRLVTLLWLHGHGGERFEVWDDLSPTGNPGGLALRGPVRNWARLVKGKLSFDHQAVAGADFTPSERDLIVQSAGVVTDLTRTAPSAVGEAHTARSHPLDAPEHQPGQERPSTGLSSVQTPEAA